MCFNNSMYLHTHFGEPQFIGFVFMAGYQTTHISTPTYDGKNPFSAPKHIPSVNTTGKIQLVFPSVKLCTNFFVYTISNLDHSPLKISVLRCSRSHQYFFSWCKVLSLLQVKHWNLGQACSLRQNLRRCSFLFGFPLICKSCNLRLKLTEPTSKPA